METFISIVDNLLTPEECKDFLEKFKALDLESNGEYNFDGQQSEFINLNRFSELQDFDDKIREISFREVTAYLKRFPWMKANYFLENSMLLKIHKNKGLPQHADNEISAGGHRRNFVVLIYLQDMPLCGDLCFPIQGVVVRPAPGRMVIAPTFFTHPHMVLPTLEDRYTYRVNFFMQDKGDGQEQY